MSNKYVAAFSTGQNDYFAGAATAEVKVQDAPVLPYSMSEKSVQNTTAISNLDCDKETPYQKSAHSVVIKKYAIKRA